MFGLLKPKPVPEGPIEFAGEVVVERAAEQVYALLDWGDPRNAMRTRGNHVTPVEVEAGRYRMIMAAIPDHVFDISVTEAEPHAGYAFAIMASPRLGRVVTSHERYGLEPLGAAACRLTLLNTVIFVDGMRPTELREEVAMMTVASHNALAKLKLQAERGIEAVKAAEDRLIV